MKSVEYYNDLILRILSYYLNDHECDIDSEQIKKVMECGVNEELAYKLLFLSYFEIEDKYFIDMYFKNIFKSLKASDYNNNPYYKNISFDYKKNGTWEIKKASYKPYELFVCNDFKYEDGKVLPQLGFFNETFSFLAVYNNDRLWMSITPNEINTMEKPISKAFGNVLTFGLGLGYFAYMCSLKENVETITIVEKDKDVIDLFTKYILPQFEFKNKIKIINIDAYDFLNNQMNQKEYDYVFVDIYHDASDGKETYLRFKPFEKRFTNTKFDYWIFETIKYYL